VKYEAIERMGEQYPVVRMCAVLGVSESGYYAWLKREPCQRAAEDATLKGKIVSLWQQFRRVYGAPRLYKELLSQGIRTSIKRVARLMREAGIQGKMPRRKHPRTTQTDDTHPVAPNLLNRQFSGKKRHEVWLTDITYIETMEGYLYVAGVLDLGSREIVGLAMADHMRTELVDKALEMALVQQRPPRGVMHHSDRGSQYTSAAYQQKLRDHGFIVSMSRTGNCLDNAPMESFWATLKRECADHVFLTHHSARMAIFSYIIGFYNRVRRHSALDYQAPLYQAA
jgi:putative transposase